MSKINNVLSAVLILFLLIFGPSCGSSTTAQDDSSSESIEQALLTLAGSEPACLSKIAAFNSYGGIEGRTEGGTKASVAVLNFEAGFLNGLTFGPESSVYVDDRLRSPLENVGCTVTALADAEEPKFLDRIKDTSWNSVICVGVIKQVSIPTGLLVMVGDYKIVGSGAGNGDAVVNAAAYLYGNGQTNNDRLNECKWFCPRTPADPCWL